MLKKIKQVAKAETKQNTNPEKKIIKRRIDKRTDELYQRMLARTY
jgi:hypothetical protein